jgi:hypothetical protein
MGRHGRQRHPAVMSIYPIPAQAWQQRPLKCPARSQGSSHISSVWHEDCIHCDATVGPRIVLPTAVSAPKTVPNAYAAH